MSNSVSNTKILAKNTLLLYFRTIVVMIVTLYMSRLILDTLGVEDYGVYNVVGGTVAMFSVLTGALASSISRFITFELGKENIERLKSIFITSVNVQLLLAISIIFIGEMVGWWFLNSTLNLPENRLDAAFWVMHCSILTFALNLINVPYNACIIAHEKMEAFAYISIVDVFLKLGVVLLLYIAPYDKLKLYACLLVVTAVIVQILYIVYCRVKFVEAKYHVSCEKDILKELSSFAGWNFLTNAAYVFNTQGINILINVFFGVSANAARGIASQVESAVMKFVNDFTTAINPQITKSYAKGDFIFMNNLVCKGAKYGYFLLLAISLPILIETDTILKLWLKTVPEYTVTFVRLSIIGTIIDRLGMTGYTACMASGNIKKYVLCITSVGCLAFPLTYVVYKLGAPVWTTYVVFACVYTCVDAVRLWIMKDLLNFPISMFCKKVVLRILITTILAVIMPLLVIYLFDKNLLRLFISIIIGLFSTCICIYLVGLEYEERSFIKQWIHTKLKKE